MAQRKVWKRIGVLPAREFHRSGAGTAIALAVLAKVFFLPAEVDC
jgi:hypothetical protein